MSAVIGFMNICSIRHMSRNLGGVSSIFSSTMTPDCSSFTSRYRVYHSVWAKFDARTSLMGNLDLPAGRAAFNASRIRLTICLSELESNRLGHRVPLMRISRVFGGITRLKEQVCQFVASIECLVEGQACFSPRDSHAPREYPARS